MQVRALTFSRPERLSSNRAAGAVVRIDPFALTQDGAVLFHPIGRLMASEEEVCFDEG